MGHLKCTCPLASYSIPAVEMPHCMDGEAEVQKGPGMGQISQQQFSSRGSYAFGMATPAVLFRVCVCVYLSGAEAESPCNPPSKRGS